MCVIFLVTTKRPTTVMINKAWAKNSHGAGIAWRDNEEVVWEKGLDAARTRELCETLPMPYVVHFRHATVGGVKPSLTHPFPISKDALLDLKGRTKGYVLFHNGDWEGWAEEIRHAAYLKGISLPLGKMSDSRAIAWLSSVAGIGFMETLPLQRGVAFGPRKDHCNDPLSGIEVYSGPGWYLINDVWCSKDNFLPWDKASSNEYRQENYKMCTFGTCCRKDLDKNDRCPLHPLIGEAKEVPGAADSHPFGLVPLELAERLQKENKISKNFLKAIRKAYLRMQEGGKQGEKAKRALQLASRSPTFAGLLPSTINGNGAHTLNPVPPATE